MKLPRVPFRFNQHEPFYQDYYKGEIFDAEIMMLSLTTGSARVRLYKQGTDVLVLSNLQVKISDFLTNTVTINWE